jgi:hypothetical protein
MQKIVPSFLKMEKFSPCGHFVGLAYQGKDIVLGYCV